MPEMEIEETYPRKARSDWPQDDFDSIKQVFKTRICVCHVAQNTSPEPWRGVFYAKLGKDRDVGEEPGSFSVWMAAKPPAPS